MRLRPGLGRKRILVVSCLQTFRISVKRNLEIKAAVMPDLSTCRPAVCYHGVAYKILRDYCLRFIGGGGVLTAKTPAGHALVF